MRSFQKKSVVESIYETPSEKRVYFFPSFSEKKLLALVLMLGIVGVWLGFFQIGKNIEKPFQYFAQKNPSVIEPALEENLGDLAFAPDADTDHDGLTDKDELNVYFTSPYLEDSDSDGKSDFEEVKNNTDPNCILGDRCFRTSLGDARISGIPPQSSPQATSGNQVTPEFLRAFFKENNIDRELYENLSDAELMAEYRKAAAGEAEENPSAPQDIQKMTPQELRAFLIKNGMEKSVVDEFSDEEIINAVKEAGS